jgi:arginyl-tRNA synthetase
MRKAVEEGIESPGEAGAFGVVEPAEKNLGLSLLRYPRVVQQVGEGLMPNRLCQYLYELAGTFAAFYEACHVLKAPDTSTRDARLKLCKLTERVLEDGLTLLGIPIIERM